MDISSGIGAKIMAKSYVLLTAIPPTIGHLHLIQFANRLSDEGTVVLICTQPGEPFAHERVESLRRAVHVLGNVNVQHLHKTIEQDPKTDSFWDMWYELMVGFGIRPGDYIVASEPYGQKVANLVGATFYPYDIQRDITNVKASTIRQNPLAHFDEILPEFQPYIRTKVTVFGAESTGKTTLSHQLAKELDGHWLFEYARPYLENTVNEITIRSMTSIWKGQVALQEHVLDLPGKPYVIQDTDLFSTVGYWQFPHWRQHIGKCPAGLIDDAIALKSDLYIITPSNIPFESDPLRYGGNVREGSDEYWVKVCKRYKLPYLILKSNTREGRLKEAKVAIKKIASQKAAKLYYDRHGL
jgi:NadR type nicotinamide-nucleotide adenylyltransferase